MPGPGEPSTTEMNHFLRPLVDEMKDFWNGITFTSTSKFPQGRKIHAALWPIHGDVPAMKKVTGFTSHSSANFCTICHITRDEYRAQSPSPKCTCRTSGQVRQQALEWNRALTVQDQNTLSDSHGVRYTVLLELPYWKSVEFFTVDIMHNVFLGMFKDFSTQYLRVPAAGKALAAEKDKMAFGRRQYNVQLPPPPPPSPPHSQQAETSEMQPPPRANHTILTIPNRQHLQTFIMLHHLQMDLTAPSKERKEQEWNDHPHHPFRHLPSFPRSQRMSWIYFSTVFKRPLPPLGPLDHSVTLE